MKGMNTQKIEMLPKREEKGAEIYCAISAPFY
jgi:hypothetical protein